MKKDNIVQYPIPIREWAEDDRPREKLLKYGENTLSNAELLAILIRTGTPGRSAVDIGRELLHRFKSLRAMSSVDISEFRKINGLKKRKNKRRSRRPLSWADACRARKKHLRSLSGIHLMWQICSCL